MILHEIHHASHSSAGRTITYGVAPRIQSSDVYFGLHTRTLVSRRLFGLYFGPHTSLWVVLRSPCVSLTCYAISDAFFIRSPQDS